MCESHFVEGLLCDCCGVCVDIDCMSAADCTIPCKALATVGTTVSLFKGIVLLVITED